MLPPCLALLHSSHRTAILCSGLTFKFVYWTYALDCVSETMDACDAMHAITSPPEFVLNPASKGTCRLCSSL